MIDARSAERSIDAWVDHRRDPGAWARALGISQAAVELYLASEVVDLHIDSFIWTRIFGYDLTRRHGHGLLGARYYSQVDLPRIREAQVSGGIWVITTNPLRHGHGRAAAFGENLARLRAILTSCPDEVALVRNHAEYVAARQRGLHAAFIGIQGGNALDHRADALDHLDGGDVIRVTLLHLSRSRLGQTSAPSPVGKRDEALSTAGKDYVRALNARRVFVDLAHINPRGFFDAAEVHDRSQPLIVTHTGVAGVHRHWRNLDDAQLRVIADTGGTIGVMYHATFLGDPLLAGRAQTIFRHLAHIVETVGEDHASLGSDWDGAIVTPADMRTCLELPRLVQHMLDAGWSDVRVGKVLGGNFLRSLRHLRGA